ncbi:DUF4190 domain-containing protein [Actinotalea sp. M2MS4P-6]|uniref:DUF4190 domain-containing protein n=1 Tax=Actinotalea sp. M2MS4P-6 TaxID=2983762 RepID=UPI0021E41B5A|nr:DUF4190 domain-containing protein [Actinotalea sp. M2MS4P-6]MCV2393065.1 DUF4190 domain-containing protein [Actinotalea sp. M2MS4P-6]
MSQPTPSPYEGQQPSEGQQPYQGQPSYPGQQPYQQPYQQGYPQQYAQQGYGYTQRGTNSLAIVSLIASISNFVILPLIGAIVGVITGSMARKQIAQTGEEGEGMAKAGVIIGWIGIAFAVVGIIFVIFVVMAASTSSSFN